MGNNERFLLPVLKSRDNSDSPVVHVVDDLMVIVVAFALCALSD